MQIHATCLTVEGCGVLLCGPPGSGKSDLALRLIDGGARLVADDRVDLSRSGDRLMASAPEPLAGLLEVRGLGLLELDWLETCAVDLVIDLAPSAEVPRLPDPARRSFLDVEVTALALAPFEDSGPAKVRLAARATRGNVRCRAGVWTP